MSNATNRRIVIAANSLWYIVNFRDGLVQALKQADYEPIIVAPDDPECEMRVSQLGVEHIRLELDRSGMNPIADALLFMKYRRILRNLRPVAFLGFTIKPNIYGAFAARTLGIPVIVNISGLGTAFLRSRALMKFVASMYRFALRRAAVVFFENRDDSELLLSLGVVRAEQAHVLPGAGVNLEHFRPSPLPSGAPTFLLVARILGDKGVREFAAAAQIVRKLCPGARFQLLGPIDEGNRTAISRAELENWVADGAVDYLGETKDVRPFIMNATAVVLPSYREGLPRSLLEAAAMARPLITTSVPGCREVVEDGKNGFLCAPRSTDELAAAMQRFCALTAAERRVMGRAGRALVERRFDEKLVIGAYLDQLRAVQSGASARSR